MKERKAQTGKVRQDRGTRRSGWDPQRSLFGRTTRSAVRGGQGKVLTERLTGSIQVKPSRGVLRWQGGRDWPLTADEADVPGEFGLRLSAL